MLDINKYQPVVSTEFIDVLKLLGLQTQKSQMAEFEKGLRDTYLNKTWLDKQTFKEGDVPAKSFYKGLIVGKEIPKNVGELMEKDLNVYIAHYEKKVKQLESYFRALKPAWDIINKAQGGPSELTLAKQAIDRVKRQEPTFHDFADMKTQVGNKEFDSKEGTIWTNARLSVSVKKEFQDVVIETAPALTREEIVELAKSCEVLVAGRETFEFGIVDFINDIDGMVVNNLKNFDKLMTAHDEGNPLFRRFDKTGEMEGNQKGGWAKIIRDNFFSVDDLHRLFENQIGDKIMGAQVQQMLFASANYIKASLK